MGEATGIGEASAGELGAPGGDTNRDRAMDKTPALGWTTSHRGDDRWVEIRDADLGQRIDVVVERVAGRPRIVGLRIDNGREVTADLLRRIRLGRILEEQLGVSSRAYDPNVPDEDLDEDENRDRAALGDWFEANVKDAADPRVRAKRGHPPSDESLHRFVALYLSELAARPRGAMPRTAKHFYMDRTTGYRWLTQARERGLIPDGGGEIDG